MKRHTSGRGADGSTPALGAGALFAENGAVRLRGARLIRANAEHGKETGQVVIGSNHGSTIAVALVSSLSLGGLS